MSTLTLTDVQNYKIQFPSSLWYANKWLRTSELWYGSEEEDSQWFSCCLQLQTSQKAGGELLENWDADTALVREALKRALLRSLSDKLSELTFLEIQDCHMSNLVRGGVLTSADFQSSTAKSLAALDLPESLAASLVAAYASQGPACSCGVNARTKELCDAMVQMTQRALLTVLARVLPPRTWQLIGESELLCLAEGYIKNPSTILQSETIVKPKNMINYERVMVFLREVFRPAPEAIIFGPRLLSSIEAAITFEKSILHRHNVVLAEALKKALHDVLRAALPSHVSAAVRGKELNELVCLRWMCAKDLWRLATSPHNLFCDTIYKPGPWPLCLDPMLERELLRAFRRPPGPQLAACAALHGAPRCALKRTLIGLLRNALPYCSYQRLTEQHLECLLDGFTCWKWGLACVQSTLGSDSCNDHALLGEYIEASCEFPLGSQHYTAIRRPLYASLHKELPYEIWPLLTVKQLDALEAAVPQYLEPPRVL